MASWSFVPAGDRAATGGRREAGTGARWLHPTIGSGYTSPWSGVAIVLRGSLGRREDGGLRSSTRGGRAGRT